MGILCIQRTMNKGRASGFFTGFGASIADIVYAIIAGFSISYVADFLTNHQTNIRLGGSIIIIGMGIFVFFSNPIKQVRQKRQKRNNFFGDFMSGFLVTITNPITVVFFGAVFAGLLDKPDFWHVILIIAGVLSGALLWWTTLVLIINKFKSKIRLRKLWLINKIMGVTIIIFGLAIILLTFLRIDLPH